MNKTGTKEKFSVQGLATKPRLAGNLRILLFQRSHCLGEYAPKFSGFEVLLFCAYSENLILTEVDITLEGGFWS